MDQDYELVGMPHGGLGVEPSAWKNTSKAAWRLELIRRGWRRCPDNVWRMPADWPPLRA